MQVAPGGYRWEKEVLAPPYEELNALTYLVGIEPEELSFRVGYQPNLRSDFHKPITTTYYNPLEQSGLHRNFADLDHLNPDEILAFANLFGFLGRSLHRVDLLADGRKDVKGELQGQWAGEMLRMRRLIQLWDLYRDPSHDSLDEIADSELQVNHLDITFDWADDHVRKVYGDSDEYRFDLFGLTPFRDSSLFRKMAVRILLRNAVNRQLEKGAYGAIDVKAGAKQVLIPSDLLGAMYILFARELTGENLPGIRCPECRDFFNPENARQAYCDKACKSKSYRKRKN